MATARDWRQMRPADGPHPAGVDDIDELNTVFSDAFSERYRKDGLVGVRVPFLNPAIWRYAIEDATPGPGATASERGSGAMLWRGAKGEVIAFNIVHGSGTEGWMGPLAVRPDLQGAGIGKEVVRAGLDWLRARSARVIGLETMPRTMDNIGFYSALGFVPRGLTVTVTLEATTAERSPATLRTLPARDRDAMVEACRALVAAKVPGLDFSRELLLTAALDLGDTVLLTDAAGGRLRGFALCHTVPLVEGRVREEVRVLKLVLDRDEDLEPMLRRLSDFARRAGTRRYAIRMQAGYPAHYARLVQIGARVRWTDLRMTLVGHEETVPATGIVLSNWEI
jgi:GNAT superfamily N-acetyltransferase